MEELDPETLAAVHRMFDHAREGRADALREALDHGLPVNLTNDSGDTLLILAAYHAKLETVAVLLEHGADTERTNDRGQTALGSAVFRQATDIVEVLLTQGANPATGSPSAVEVARFFELDAMATRLAQPPT